MKRHQLDNALVGIFDNVICVEKEHDSDLGIVQKNELSDNNWIDKTHRKSIDVIIKERIETNKTLTME